MTAVRLLVPEGAGDPRRVSGGNVYDLEVRDGLRRRGWTVTVAEAAGAADAASAVRGLADGALLLVDGLVAARAADELEAVADRLRVVVLAHMVVAAFADATAAEIEAERRALASARRIVVTSSWTAAELVRRGLADADRITVAVPGVAPGPVARHAGDRALLCVGVVARHKGQDTLLAALARLCDRDWGCVLAGSPDASPAFAARIARRAAAFDGRVRLAGVLDRPALADAYDRTALLVAPSRVESAGMAIAEARARGIPVIGTTVGGIPETVSGGGALLVRPGDPVALADALHGWMTDAALRERLRREALAVRRLLPRWDATTAAVAGALEAA